jgi:hypothetical protein
MNTCFAIVTCCLEQGRYDILTRVVDNIRSQACFKNIVDNIIVFDNASTVGNVPALFHDFKHVYACAKNIGYWTALRWITHQHASIVGEKKFFYPIESDCIHYADMTNIAKCEQFLTSCPDVGMVRTQEFIVAESNLYDKNKPCVGSRRYAWQSQVNRFRYDNVPGLWCGDAPVYFTHAVDNIYRTNFTAVACGLARMPDAIAALDSCALRAAMSEVDYQLWFDRYSENALYDGGLFHSRLSFNDIWSVAGSRPDTLVAGYRSTQQDKIEPDGSYIVTKLT